MCPLYLASENMERLKSLADKTGRTKSFHARKPFSDILRLWRIPSLPLNDLKRWQNSGL